MVMGRVGDYVGTAQSYISEALSEGKKLSHFFCSNPFNHEVNKEFAESLKGRVNRLGDCQIFDKINPLTVTHTARWGCYILACTIGYFYPLAGFAIFSLIVGTHLLLRNESVLDDPSVEEFDRFNSDKALEVAIGHIKNEELERAIAVANVMGNKHLKEVVLVGIAKKLATTDQMDKVEQVIDQIKGCVRYDALKEIATELAKTGKIENLKQLVDQCYCKYSTVLKEISIEHVKNGEIENGSWEQLGEPFCPPG